MGRYSGKIDRNRVCETTDRKSEEEERPESLDSIYVKPHLTSNKQQICSSAKVYTTQVLSLKFEQKFNQFPVIQCLFEVISNKSIITAILKEY